MAIETIKKYLKNQITNSWYYNSKIDYGIEGKFLNAEIIEKDLKIVWNEMGKQLEMVITYFAEYTLEQLYTIWMEIA